MMKQVLQHSNTTDARLPGKRNKRALKQNINIGGSLYVDPKADIFAIFVNHLPFTSRTVSKRRKSLLIPS
ncbi:hypothetical protein K1719_005612 [Acacia pycnantha]|nr:hypothetical protein K1719_005612 [Acacia pycnantha]